MSDKFIVRSPKPSFDIPDISAPEMMAKMLGKLDPNTTCVVSVLMLKFCLILNGFQIERSTQTLIQS